MLSNLIPTLMFLYSSELVERSLALGVTKVPAVAVAVGVGVAKFKAPVKIKKNKRDFVEYDEALDLTNRSEPEEL